MHSSENNIRILVAPLDWGLGHATRCVPIIGELKLLGCEIVLAADGAIAKLLAREFPEMEIRILEGYKIQYGKKGLFLGLFLQLPRIFRTIKKEKKWLNNLLQKEKFDFVISDNRPGLWSKATICIYITHQLFIESGKGNFLNSVLQKLHSNLIKKFNVVWVPDLGDEKNLGGKLSHPTKQMLAPVYIGLLSRLSSIEKSTILYDVMILLSGPEPHRSVLEDKIMSQLTFFEGKALFVRGMPGETKKINSSNTGVTIYNHLTATELQREMQQSEFIICRSGYTTLMDLIKLRKKAILIPTPGQPEQEYLAAYMQEQSYFPFITQDNFELKKMLERIKAFSYKNPFTDSDFELYRDRIEELIVNKNNT